MTSLKRKSRLVLSLLGHAFGDGGGVVAGVDDDVGSVLDDDGVGVVEDPGADDRDRVVLINRQSCRRGGDAPGSRLMRRFPEVTSTSESELSSTTTMGVASCCL
jgi:hypothetical protein